CQHHSGWPQRTF
nr:immunoglobulin light chain junction region [Macaca mulatta]